MKSTTKYLIAEIIICFVIAWVILFLTRTSGPSTVRDEDLTEGVEVDTTLAEDSVYDYSVYDATDKIACDFTKLSIAIDVSKDSVFHYGDIILVEFSDKVSAPGFYFYNLENIHVEADTERSNTIIHASTTASSNHSRLKIILPISTMLEEIELDVVSWSTLIIDKLQKTAFTISSDVDVRLDNVTCSDLLILPSYFGKEDDNNGCGIDLILNNSCIERLVMMQPVNINGGKVNELVQLDNIISSKDNGLSVDSTFTRLIDFDDEMPVSIQNVKTITKISNQK